MSREMTLAEARSVVGSLSFPSKMPGSSFALSAYACQAGAKFAATPGTVCSICYSLRGQTNYHHGNAPKGMARRLAGLDDPRWVQAMVRLLLHTHSKPRIKVDLGIVGVRRQAAGGSRYQWNEPGWHRWHDSGDLQSVQHLRNICEVARLTPRIRHWLPTLEAGMVKGYLAQGGIVPDNLVIRMSSPMLDVAKVRNWPTTSSVYTALPPEGAHVCPAQHQDHRCGDCRACWSREVAHVAYPAH